MGLAWIGKNDILISKIPEWVSKGQTIVNKEKRRQEDNAAFPRYLTIHDSDANYVDVDYGFLVELIRWTKNFAKQVGIHYVKDGFDCDKFSKAFSLALDVAVMHAGVEAQARGYRMSTLQINSWAGVPAGGAHSLIVVKTRQKGYIVIEGQNGTMCELKDYPNRKHVYELLIGK